MSRRSYATLTGRASCGTHAKLLYTYLERTIWERERCGEMSRSNVVVDLRGIALLLLVQLPPFCWEL